MGVKERTAWIAHIERLDIPEWLKEQMRQKIVAHDQLLGSTLSEPQPYSLPILFLNGVACGMMIPALWLETSTAGVTGWSLLFAIMCVANLA